MTSGSSPKTGYYRVSREVSNVTSDTRSALELDLSASIRRFAQTNSDYYVAQFLKIQTSTHHSWSFNKAAALFGPLWAGARGAWGFFWLFAIVELTALVQFGRGLWGDLGADKMAEVYKLEQRASEMLAQAETARAAGDATGATALQEIGGNLGLAAQATVLEAEQATAGATTFLIVGLVLFVAIRIAMGFLANTVYEKQYTRWRTDHTIQTGRRRSNTLFGALMVVIMYPLTLYRFTASKPDPRLVEFPVGSEYYVKAAKALESWFDRTAVAGQGVFDGITGAVQTFLDLLELILVDTPWPVVVTFVIIVAWRVAGARVAIFVSAALAYLGLLGFWETSMITFALVGTAALICLVVGIPLGVWFSKSARAYAIARPVLDLMQTLPPFVYLIPIIAFFGTGKVPGVLATIIVGMPPCIRLTALGLMQVDGRLKEAARAFGATNRQLLTGLELPLAMPSIMTGINQTILLCLAMVVIASLIGAKGLGQDVLVALMYVAKGQGLLAGLAILFSAMILDRIVQGRFKQRGDSG